MKTLAWNTGRPYSDKGQRMAATSHGEFIVFVDVDRGIDGFFAHHELPHDKEDIMDFYDNDRFKECYMNRDLTAVVRQLVQLANSI